MLSSRDFIRQSLETHLFFARIMKGHSFFLEASFTPKDSAFMERADEFRREFDKLLGEVVLLSNGVLGQGVLRSGEVVTPYTEEAEKATSFFTGVKIPVEITKAEEDLMPGRMADRNSKLERKVSMVNKRAIELTAGLIKFKEKILSNVLACKMFTFNYPLLITHIIREESINGKNRHNYSRTRPKLGVKLHFYRRFQCEMQFLHSSNMILNVDFSLKCNFHFQT